jgi:hypothetical protein
MKTMTDEQAARYLDLCHAHQSGVAADLSTDERNFDDNAHLDIMRVLKHHRVGIDGALVEQGALVKLLFEKGVFKEEEYFAAIIIAREEEVKQYEGRISERLGKNVKFV